MPASVVAAVVEPAWDLWEGSVRLRAYRALRRRQWWPAERVARIQRERLSAIVRHAAATCPFYAERFRAAGIDPAAVRGLGDLAGLPPLAKSDVRERAADLFSRAFRRDELIAARTGGSTGVALQVWCDRRGVQERAGAARLADTWSGWRPGEPVAAVWGNPPVPRGWRGRLRAAVKDRFIFLDTMRLDDAAIDRFLADWRRVRPGLLYGHAHSLFLLADSLARRGVAAPRPQGIVATSMMLLQPERAVVERVFGVRVTDRYGCEELGLIACECERHAGLHLNAELVAVEVLRPDGAPAAAGEAGRLVITDLANRGQPLLRYEVGDWGALAPEPCPCGRGWPLLARLVGRTADFLVARDGARVAGISLIENTLTRYPGIRQLQLVQETRTRVVVNLAPADGYGEPTARGLTETLQRSLGADVAVEIRLVERIAQEASGKYRFAICKVDG